MKTYEDVSLSRFREDVCRVENGHGKIRRVFLFFLPFLTLMVLGREEGVFDRGIGKSLDSLEY